MKLVCRKTTSSQYINYPCPSLHTTGLVCKIEPKAKTEDGCRMKEGFIIGANDNSACLREKKVERAVGSRLTGIRCARTRFTGYRISWKMVCGVAERERLEGKRERRLRGAILGI